ncbi:MAG: sigma 54-interacting transcriptional regulator, partial [Verrucomicrobiota bacterium]
MNLPCLWIVEAAPTPHADALQALLEDAGGWQVVRHRSAPPRPPSTGVTAVAPEAGFVVLPGSAALGQHPGLAGRLELPRGIPWLLVAEHGSPGDFLAALQEGFSDFLLAPLRTLDVLPRLRRHLGVQAVPDLDIQALKERLGLQHIVGRSPALLVELRKIPVMARCDSAVLIAGETGTGKEACARAIHYLGPRARHPFVAVNCGAIPPELVENELFGHDAGAFTGAASARAGLVEEASGGTLFLDEVDSLPLAAQVK